MCAVHIHSAGPPGGLSGLGQLVAAEVDNRAERGGRTEEEEPLGGESSVVLGFSDILLFEV